MQNRVKKQVRRWCYKITSNIAGTLGKAPFNGRTAVTARPGRTLLIAPDGGPGSFGDEAMVAAVAQTHSPLMDSGSEMRVLYTSETGTWPLVDEASLSRVPSFYRPLFASDLLRFIEETRPGDHVVFIGADTLDEGHDDEHLFRTTSVIKAMTDRGAKLSVINFTLRGDAEPPAHVKELLSRAHLRTARDATTHERLKSMGLSSRLAPDLALAFRHDSDEQRADIVVANVSGHAMVFSDGSDLRQVFAEAISLDAQGSPTTHYELLPHDVRPIVGDKEALREVNARLKRSDVPVQLHEESFDPHELRDVVSRAEFVVTSRMHLAIAALSVGRIPICVMYFEDKFRGQLNWWGLPDWLMISGSEVTGASLFTTMQRVRREKHDLERQIAFKRDELQSAARQNIQAVLES